MVCRGLLNLLACWGTDMSAVHHEAAASIWAVVAWAHSQSFDSRDDLFCIRPSHFRALSNDILCDYTRIVS
jgi:hypothetical protein